METAASEGQRRDLSPLPSDPRAQQASVGAVPVELWRDLNRRFRLLWMLLLTSLPGTFASAWLLSGLLRPKATLALIGLLWMAAVAAAGWHIARFACPRCGSPFFESWIFLKMLRDRCAHCALPRHSTHMAPR
jgi:hypothetical protein